MPALHSKRIRIDISVLDWVRQRRERWRPQLLTDSGGPRLVRQGECRRGRGAVKPPFCFCVAGLWLYYINLGAVRYILITVLAARSKGVKSALRHR